jgi:hypothetical protein
MSEHPWGVRMPAWIHLNEFADQCERLGGEVYLVGSALRTKRQRDVDIRQEVPDSRFRELFWDMREFGKPPAPDPDATDA